MNKLLLKRLIQIPTIYFSSTAPPQKDGASGAKCVCYRQPTSLTLLPSALERRSYISHSPPPRNTRWRRKRKTSSNESELKWPARRDSVNKQGENNCGGSERALRCCEKLMVHYPNPGSKSGRRRKWQQCIKVSMMTCGGCSNDIKVQCSSWVVAVIMGVCLSDWGKVGFCPPSPLPFPFPTHTHTQTILCWPSAQTASHCGRKERLASLVDGTGGGGGWKRQRGGKGGDC